MTALVLGVDPDAHGALALVDRESGELVELVDMPEVQEKGRRRIDVLQLAGLLDEWSTRIGEAYVEKAWARPTDTGPSAFVVGHNYGAVLGVVCAHFVRLHIVTPQAWKRAMGVTSDKETSRTAASLKFPAECRRWALKKHHGRAEAALIAAYGRRELLRESARG